MKTVILKTKKQYSRFIEKLIEMDIDPGRYEYNGFVMRISLPTRNKKRMIEKYQERREAGLCIRCGEPVQELSRRTGKLFSMCKRHRDMVKK